MLQTHTHGTALSLDMYVALNEQTVHVASRMARSKNDGSVKSQFTACLQVNSLNSRHALTFHHKTRHLGLEMHLAATFYDGVAHVLNDARQLVGADMRMSICKDRSACSVLAEHIEDFVHVASLL